MKLEHLIQAYHFNKINVKIEKEINNLEEKAGVIKFDDDINASYLLDDEGIVVAMNLFSNSVVANNRTIDNQMKHTINTLIIIQKTIEFLGNTKQEESNNILKQLGLFSGKIETKAVRFIDYVFKIESVSGLLMFTIIKEKATTPPVKSERASF